MPQTTVTNIQPIFNSEPTSKFKPLSYNWKTLTKAGLVFVTTTGTFLALKTTGSFGLITSWLKNKGTDFDEQGTKLAVSEEAERLEAYKDLQHITFMSQKAKRSPMEFPEKIGPEFQVNTYTTIGQLYPSVTELSDGKFVVTWHGQGNGDSWGIYGQMYNANGTKFLSESQVNTYTTNSQEYPSVAGLSDGKFVVIWTSVQDGNDNGIYGQMFNANGTKYLSEFQVNTYVESSQEYPSVAGLGNGKFVVTWHSNGQDGYSWGVFGQMHNADNSRYGLEFRVNTYTTYDQSNPSVARLGDGKFVVTWVSEFQDGSTYGIYGQLFNANGTKFLSEFQVNTSTTSSQNYPSVAGLSDGKFVVIWQSDCQDGYDYDIYGQMYNADGSKYLSEFQVNTYTTLDQRYPFIAGLSDGKFVVTWTSEGQDGDLNGIYGQIFNANGTKYLSEFQVNTYVGSSQEYPSVAGLGNGKFVVTWHSNDQDGDLNGIYGQMFRAYDSFSNSYFSDSRLPSSNQQTSESKSTELSSQSGPKSTEPFSRSKSEAPGINIAIIIGAVLGALAGITCLIGTIGGVYFWRRRKGRDEINDNAYQLSELKIAGRKSLSFKGDEKFLGTIDPQKLSKFEEIGRGAMGVVYKAIYHGSHVAVKQALINLADYEALKQLAQEATLMEELRHPNIVQFLGYYQDATHYSIVMEYVSGGELTKVLYDTRKEFPWHPTRWDIAHDVASAVSYLHTNDTIQIIHRDLKSPNVLVYYEGTRMRAKVADVGIAKVVSEDEMATMTKGMGTPLWMAPEVIEAQGERKKITYDEKVDVYSYGIILSELVNRKEPFSEIKNRFDVVPSVLQGIRPLVNRDKAPVSFIALMERCWAQRATDRPEMEEVVNTLDQMEPEVKSFEC
jgi:tRNA A-37 threonylcarbamoyl transferase component Bud32